MIRNLLLSAAFISLCLLAVPLSAAASYNPFAAVPCGQHNSVNSSAVCTDSQNPTQNPFLGKDGILINATHIIAFITGITAIILIIVGGLRYVTSNGDSGKIEGAKNTIINALIGIVIIVVAQSLITYVLNRLP